MRPLLFLLTLTSLALAAPEGMVEIPGGTYTRGADSKRFQEEGPSHQVTIDAFYLDIHEVTNAQFLKFTEATGYRTQAERGWSAEDFPKAPPGTLKPGAMVFSAPPEAVKLSGQGAEWQWWQFREGASWRSHLKGRENHPVTCVTWEDANAYAKWAGKRLPTEAEWERAARGGKEKKTFVWGNEAKPDPSSWPANIFTGEFPNNDTGLDGHTGTSPVKSFPPNAYGLYDMAGNVWEHCSDFYYPNTYHFFIKDPHPNPTGPKRGVSQPEINWFFMKGKYPSPAIFGKQHPLSLLHVTRGGSYLCHHSYCLRYRPSARHYSESLAPSNHTGFRCAQSKPTP